MDRRESGRDSENSWLRNHNKQVPYVLSELWYDTAGTNVIKFDAADVTWAASTITARYAVIYKDTGSAATSPLLSYVDFGQNESTSGSTFQITWDAAGILTITPA